MESAQILFDANITGLEYPIKELASARSFDGRVINASHLKESEVLIVRSVTKVDRSLLGGSKIKLVCSATAGLDHVDVDYLVKSGIKFFFIKVFIFIVLVFINFISSLLTDLFLINLDS